MSLKRSWAIGFCLLAFLSVPRQSAALFNWIHEMSGPRMIGFGYTCKPFSPRPFRHLTPDQAGAVDEQERKKFSTKGDDIVSAPTMSWDTCFGRKPDHNVGANRAHFWARYEGNLYASYEHEADPRNHTVGAVSQGLMLEASPVHPFHEDNEVVLFFGAGVEVFRFFGDHFKPFTRTAIKLRPVGVRLNRVGKLKALELAVDVRRFGRRFVPQDFGVPSQEEVGRGGEWVFGTFVSLVFH